jgi:hypothetical protein
VASFIVAKDGFDLRHDLVPDHLYDIDLEVLGPKRIGLGIDIRGIVILWIEFLVPRHRTFNVYLSKLFANFERRDGEEVVHSPAAMALPHEHAGARTIPQRWNTTTTASL